MKHISIIIPDGDFSLSNLEATYKMFNMTNENLMRFGKQPLFDIHFVGAHQKERFNSGAFSIKPDLIIEEITKTDLIIIPAIHGDYQQILENNKVFVPWIIQQYKKGAEVASLCIGAFLLASTGLLDGKSCATHWFAASDFRDMFPDVNLLDDKIITDENGIYTSGGAYSSLNLNLYLVEKFAGREMAVRSSKIFEIDINRSSQSPFIIFNAQKSHHDQEILTAQTYIEENFMEKIAVDALCEKIAVGRRTFERRFKKATSNTIIEYIHRVRVEAAKKQLEQGNKNVNQVMYEVGFSDPKAFREVFRKITHMTPVDYLNKYGIINAS